MFLLHTIKNLESAHINEVIIRNDGSAIIGIKTEKFKDVQKTLTQNNCNVCFFDAMVGYCNLSSDVKMVKQTFNILYNAKYLSEDDYKAISGALLGYKNMPHSITTFIKKNLQCYDCYSLKLNIFCKKNNIENNDEKNNEKPLNKFYCPITKALMKDPVIVAGSKKTYEREAIMEWFKSYSIDPETKADLSQIPNGKMLTENSELKKMINDYKESVAKSIAKSIIQKK